LACELLKQVVRYFTTSIYFEVQNNIWEEVKDSGTWIGLVFAIVLVVLSTWVLDNWKWAHPRREVRSGLLLISIILTAIVDLPGRIFKGKLLKAYGMDGTQQTAVAIAESSYKGLRYDPFFLLCHPGLLVHAALQVNEIGFL
jgi:hypothetical protein